jgi:hypothetical protein
MTVLALLLLVYAHVWPQHLHSLERIFGPATTTTTKPRIGKTATTTTVSNDAAATWSTTELSSTELVITLKTSLLIQIFQ